ncbi:MAG: AAA family ATPase [Planctomycetota bacterium]
MPTPAPLPKGALAWRVDPDWLTFETTSDVEPVLADAGQEAAVEALRFGIECSAPHQNVYVRGLTGTGRMRVVRRLLDELNPRCHAAADHCYVHRFSAPDRPRLITLEAGQGRRFRRRVREVQRFVREDLPELLKGNAVTARREELEAESMRRSKEVTAPFEADLQEASLTMLQQQQGNVVQTTIVPLFEGAPVDGQRIAELHASGEIDDARIPEWREAREAFAKRFAEISREVQAIQLESAKALMESVETMARAFVEGAAEPIRREFAEDGVSAFLDELVQDVVDSLGRNPGTSEDHTELYDVNLLLEPESGESSPVVVETTPTMGKLLGLVETGWSPAGPTPGDFRSISAGSILRANGGYLVLEARDLLVEPGAWRVLVRALRTGQLEIVPQELSLPYLRASIKPDPIPIQVRVILVGDAWTFHVLDGSDPDFGHLFKVLSDFDSEIDRDANGVLQYASAIAELTEHEDLTPFDRSAVAALAEHGARIVSRAGKLTARFSRIADIAREAAYLAGKEGRQVVTAEDVQETVRRTKRRADLSSRRFHALIAQGTIVVETEGRVVGQVNGLAVIQAGMLTYGFPARITATIGPGNAGIIDIEATASMSGQIHTKGFHILGGLLRHLLAADHSFAFSASLAFEQSYGGIDGDSASGAEICCLLSALTDIPLRQDIAMTGAIDQHGRIQAIGGVNEKIEGFFDAASALGLSGEGGVIIPQSNAGDLMLRKDVVEACADGRFHVWAVATVHEALEIFTGVETGVLDEEGEYPEESLLGIARDRAFEFWQRTLTSPAAYVVEEIAEEGDAETENA